MLAYGAVRIAVTFLARPRFAQAVAATYPFTDAEPRRGMQDWPVSVVTVDRLGTVIGQGLSLDVGRLAQTCPALQTSAGEPPDFAAIDACVRQAGVAVRTLYQPGSRYWTFQWIEFGIFVGLAAALVLVALAVVRRRSA